LTWDGEVLADGVKCEDGAKPDVEEEQKKKDAAKRDEQKEKDATDNGMKILGAGMKCKAPGKDLG